MPQDQIVSGSTTLTAYQATYHWRNKNCFPWASQWFKANLPGLSVEKDGQSAEIAEVTEVEGDVDLGQRKGKILTIYDCRLIMKWKGKTADGEDCTGTLTIPEVSHEMIDGLEDYTYEFSSTSSTSFYNFLKSNFPAVLAAKLNTFPKILVETHGQPSSGSATPTTETPSSTGELRSSTPATKAEDKDEKKKESLVGGTGSITVEARLAASADDLWGFLTDEKRVPMWTRAPAKIQPTADTPYEMFGGNIHGQVVEVEKGSKLVQSWQLRSPSWPSEHFAKLTTTLKQGDDSTMVTWTLAGVPKRQEETLKGALEGYYINGFRQIGLVISSSPSRITIAPAENPITAPNTRTSTKSDSSRSKGTKSTKSKTKRPKADVNETGWGDLIGYGLILSSVVGFAGIVWGSFRQ